MVWPSRTEQAIVIAIGVLAGVIARFAGAAPTGTSVIDAVLVVASVALLCWAASSAPWWLVAGFGIVAAALAPGIVVIVIAVAAFALAVATARPASNQRAVASGLRATSAGVSANAVLWSSIDVFLGFTTIVGIAAAVAVAIGGIATRPTHVRRRVATAIALTAVAAVAAVAGVGLAANSARTDLASGGDAARRAVTELQRGDYSAAAASFERAADLFERGADQVGGPLTLGGRVIPGMAQNLSASRGVTGAAANTAHQAALALREIDPASITLDNGGVDLDELIAAEQHLLVVRGAVDRLATSVDDASSPWLVAPLRREIDELAVEIDENVPRIDSALTAVALAPSMLGNERPRHYLILFTTPAEARGLGGFSGNYAEAVIDNGVVSVNEFGRSLDLNERLAAANADCDACSDEFLNGYGVFGFSTGPNEQVGPLAWLNITMPAHFPLVADTAATLYREAGGNEIDGVIVMDPYVVAELMRFTGPIRVPDLGVTVAADDVADFLIFDQYVLTDDKDQRVDALDTLGRTAIVKMLESTLPSPIDLAERFAPLVEERRLLFWSNVADEQDFLNDIGLLGALPELSDEDGGFSLAVTNASANKIDSFLEREVSITEDRSTDGTRRLVADVTLTNTAPSAGLPTYVIDNEVGLPTGTSRLLVTYYGPATFESATLDGQPIGVERFEEGGWFGHRHAVDIGPGQSVSTSIVFTLDNPGGETFEPTTWEQPLRR